MCQSGKWLRPNQSTLDRIRIAFAALKTPYYRTAVIQSRGLRRGHNPWQKEHHKAMDAKRGVLKRGKYISIWDLWQKNEVHRECQLVHGWTDEWIKYLEYISEIDISHNAPHRQRLRYESTVYMRGVDSNKQAGPLCQRPDYKSSANALVILQRAQGKGVPHIPIKERTRQDNTLDPEVQKHLEWLSFNWPTYFSSSSSSTWKENFKKASMARLALSRVARQRMVGSVITSTMSRSSTSSGTKRLAGRCDKVSAIVKFT